MRTEKTPPLAYEIARDILIEIKEGFIDTPARSPNTKTAVLIPPRIDNQLCDICWQVQTTEPDHPTQTTPVAHGNEAAIERILDTSWLSNYQDRMQKCLRFLQELDPPYSPLLAQQSNLPPIITATTSKYQRATLTPTHEIKIEPIQNQLTINIQWGVLSKDFPNSILGPSNSTLPLEQIPQLQSQLSTLKNANYHTPFLPPFYARQSFQTFAHDPDSLNQQIDSLNPQHISIFHHPNTEDVSSTRITLTSLFKSLDTSRLHHRRSTHPENKTSN